MDFAGELFFFACFTKNKNIVMLFLGVLFFNVLLRQCIRFVYLLCANEFFLFLLLFSAIPLFDGFSFIKKNEIKR